jgi:type IX secretion system PorP/SprF family membrane protein
MKWIKLNRHYTLFFLLVIAPFQAFFAQDIQLTQFYSAPCFLNPALAGDESCARLTTNFRKQWPGAGNGYTSTLVSYDSYVHKIHGGLGFLFTRDVAGTANLTTTSFSGIYNYQIQIDRNWQACFATQVGGVTKLINYYNLLFGDQIARGGAPTTIEALPRRANYLDISSGMMIYSHDMWYGLSVHHLNTPNESMLGAKSKLPMKISLQGGETFKIGGKNGDLRLTDMSVTIALNYKHQERFDQLDVGAYFNKNNFVGGIWYRGIPSLIKSYKPGYPNNDALCFLIGYLSDRFRLGYSYDQTISWLIGNTRGAHEVSFAYQFCAYTKFRPKKRFVVSCPKF